MLHPGAAFAFTSMGTSLVVSVSIATTIGAGVCTVTPSTVDVAMTLSFTAEPGLACDASALAMVLLERVGGGGGGGGLGGSARRRPLRVSAPPGPVQGGSAASRW